MPAPFLSHLERISQLHNHLADAFAQGCEGVASETLLAALNCERKALYRIAAELKKMGAPVYYDDELHLWRYLSVWNFPIQFVYTVEGAVGMRLSLDCLLDPELERDLDGILAVSPELRSGKTTLPRLTGRFSPHLLGLLARAMKERRRASFIYRKPHETTPRQRVVEPLEIFEWNGMPYLQAREVGDIHVFKRFALSRIEELKLLEERFRRPSRTAVPSCLGAFCNTPFEAEIEADAEHAAYVCERRWHPRQKITARKEGSLVFTLPFGDPDEAARWILGQGPGFRPLKPQALVTSWNAMIRKLAAHSRVTFCKC